MKNYVIGLILLVFLLIAGAFFRLFSEQTAYHKAINASAGGVLVLSDIDDAKLKIIVAKTDKITVELEGSGEKIAVTSLERANQLLAELGIDGGWSGVSGTITVPEGILIDIGLSSDVNLIVTDISGRSDTKTSSFIIDTNSVSSVNVTGDGTISVVGWDEVEIIDDETWEVIGGEGETEGEEGEEETGVYCGVGGQSVRDYCCESINEDNPQPVCDGFGHWIFNNAARDCQYLCEAAELQDCSIGSQNERDGCCASNNAGNYMGCVGDWRYNNSSKLCQFDCVEFVEDEGGEGEGEESNNNGESDPQYADPTSQYCFQFDESDTKSLCCNDALKNSLSSGPRPGFPDCIGKYYFDRDEGCLFRCAEHTEMNAILEEIRQNIQSE